MGSTYSSCSARRRTKLGSSTYMEHEVEFLGILSHDPLQNPDFFNWNKVKIRYCDGSSFSSHPDNEFGNGTKIFFRGQIIWDTVMDELLSIGMSKAREALLTGCSAGGLATLIHCDDFRSLLPRDTNVKCLADAGFFLNEKDIAGNRTIDSFYHDVLHLQGVAKSLNHDCITRSEPHKVHFVVCYRNSLLKTLTEFQQNPEMGVFINSCFVHCQTWAAETWHSPTSPRINNKTVAESVGDWYFKRAAAKQIDCPYPCNPTCYNMDLNRG
ncbi:UNVERIFIED_CONTAM: Pectin acetylesterase 5 [Sesamum radiatum]|uniref:Pectin acetylesterase n=1 Tax=Sesamum radiatum TaxID=300843 RepID=A0AAW2LB22_SESRA